MFLLRIKWGNYGALSPFFIGFSEDQIAPTRADLSLKVNKAIK